MSPGSIRTDLYPYGEVWSETGGGTKYKMTGKERDSESSNDFFGARYYVNVTGKWLGVDPIFARLQDQRLDFFQSAQESQTRFSLSVFGGF
ncbi:MAG: hypothetical protein HY315_00130 [Acidobacteria bacterium]|nr:hypothetical protein [Acidobacteriota bacterium]